MSDHHSSRTSRRGISLLEVIACTALVAVMIVPIAGVIRTSGQSISQAQGDPSTEAKLRRGLLWLGDYVRNGSIVGVRSARLSVLPSGGSPVEIRVSRNNLVLSDGTDTTVIVEDVRDIEFSAINQATPPNSLVGLTMRLRARDPNSGQIATVDSTVSVPTQY